MPRDSSALSAHLPPCGLAANGPRIWRRTAVKNKTHHRLNPLENAMQMNQSSANFASYFTLLLSKEIQTRLSVKTNFY
jgi:hypothetical protein